MGVVGRGKGVVYLASSGRPTDIGFTVGQSLLCLQQVRVEVECFYFFCFLTLIHFPLSSLNRHSGSVVERPVCDREVAGSIPGRVIPKTLKMVLAALSLGAQH